MSRIGKQPIILPKGVTVLISENQIVVAGPKGELKRTLSADMQLRQEDGKITVSRPSDSLSHRALHGLTRTLVANMVKGVSDGYEKSLEIVGVGYRADKDGDKLSIRVGYTHPVQVAPPSGIKFAVEGQNKIRVSGIDKELVGQVAANIRFIREPDDYKGKGIRYSGEYVRLKPGKAVGKGK